jgi:hypothetical protein
VKANRNIDLKINGSAIDLPITEASRVCTAPAANFPRHVGRLSVSAALFGFSQRAFGSWRERFGTLGCGGFRIVVVRFLHHALLPENIENSLRVTKS